MIIWTDAHLSPAIAVWITANFEVTALSLRDLGLRDAEDVEIFAAAKAENATVMTKDGDFVSIQPFWCTTTSHLVDLWKYVQCSVKRNIKFNAT
jgi:predicted nuclease of predicted toxin-antitoxin system